MVGRCAGKEHLAQDVDGLDKSVDSHPRLVIGDPRCFVVGPHPASPDTELEAALAHQVECGQLLGQHHRMPVVVVEDEAADIERARGLGSDGECDERTELIVEVVRDIEGRVAEVFELARQLAPRCAGIGFGELYSEAEGSHPSSLGA